MFRWGKEAESSPRDSIFLLYGAEMGKLLISKNEESITVLILFKGPYGFAFLMYLLLLLPYKKKQRSILLRQFEALKLHSIELIFSHVGNSRQL